MAKMDLPFKFEDDRRYSITVEPSPYVLGLERRVEQLEKREQRMYKVLVENGLIKEGEEELGGDVEDREQECEDDGRRNEFGVVMGAELLMDVDEIDWNGRETPPPFLERETSFVSEAETDFVPCHPPNLKEGLSDALAVAVSSKNEGEIETGGARVSKAPRKKKAESVKTRGRGRPQKPVGHKGIKCLTCGKYFANRGTLSHHCTKTGHGNYCATSKMQFNTEVSWTRHLSMCSHDHSGCDDQAASGSADANLETVAKAKKSLKKKKSRPSPKPASSKELLTSNWICIECDESFAKEYHLSRHCRNQEPRHGKHCPVFGRWFFTKMSWEKHTSSCSCEHQRADVPALPWAPLSCSTLSEEQDEYTPQEYSPQEYSPQESCAACLDGGDLLWCSSDGCNVLYHLGCMDPPLKEIPEGDWFCKGCEALRQAQLRGNASPEKRSEEQAEFAEGNSVEEGPAEIPVDVVAAAVSTKKATSGNQQNKGTIASRKSLRTRQKRVPKPVEPLDCAVEQDGVNQASSSSQNDNGSDKDVMSLELERAIGDGNNLGGGANPDSIPALKLRVLGKMLAELENMQGNNSNAK